MAPDAIPKRTERVLDARSLRGLAHPLRIRLLGMLRAEGPATATQLADRLGERSGTTSWHLRQLAEHGFIEDVPGKGTTRERWWRAAQQGTRIHDKTEFLADPVTRGALDVYLHEILTISFQRAAAFLAEEDSWGADWVRASTLSDWRLHLTPPELRELGERVDELIQSYRREAGPTDTTVAVQVQGFPYRRLPQADQ